MELREFLVPSLIAIVVAAIGSLIASFVFRNFTRYRPKSYELDILHVIDYAEHYFAEGGREYVPRQMDTNDLPIVEKERDDESHPISLLCLQPGEVSWGYSSEDRLLFGEPRKKPFYSPDRIEVSGDYYHAAEKLRSNYYLRSDGNRLYLSYVGREYVANNRRTLRRRDMVERHRLHGTRSWRNMFRGKLWEIQRFRNNVKSRNMEMERCHRIGGGIRIASDLRESNSVNFWSAAIEFPVDSPENNPCDVTLLIIDIVDREKITEQVNKDVEMEVADGVQCYFVQDSVLYRSQRLVHVYHQDNGISHLWFDGGGTRKPIGGGGYLIVGGCSEEERVMKERKIIGVYYNDASGRLGGLLRSVGI